MRNHASDLKHGTAPSSGECIGCTTDEVPPFTPLTARQRKGLLRLGDVAIPGDDVMPSFSQSNCADGINRMLPYMYPSDSSSLKALLDACAYLPKPVIAAICFAGDKADAVPGPLAGAFRMANIGIKGVVHSLYWSDLGSGRVWEKVDYDPAMNEAAYQAALDEKAGEQR